MARIQKVKLYRIPISFHDGYVAAPSQKAALAAWGADADLSARGVAEVVKEGGLTAAHPNHPGTVIRILRGTSAEHIAALPEDRPVRRKAAADAEDEGPPPHGRGKTGRARLERHPTEKTRLASGTQVVEAASPRPATARGVSKPEPRPRPRPSRARLDEAEKALERAQKDHKEAIARIREQARELQQNRRDLERRHEADVAKLETVIGRARESHRAALKKWRA